MSTLGSLLKYQRVGPPPPPLLTISLLAVITLTWHWAIGQPHQVENTEEQRKRNNKRRKKKISQRKRKAKKKNEEKHTSGAEYVPSSGANSESQKCNIERCNP